MTSLGLSATEFLAQYWQRQHLYVAGADFAPAGLVDGDDLAGLACEEGVESRVVLGDGDGVPFSCTHGPFDDSFFATLADGPWSLLVQGVDQWIPEVADVLAAFTFLPAWRLDDVMVSYAMEGGGVGPHFDYYDVFLLQVSGTRRWRLGAECDARTRTVDAGGLRQLADWQTVETVDTDVGDLLYIPAGKAHWGTATSPDCITVSVGFRAPSHAQLLRGLVHEIAESIPEDERFVDGPLEVPNDRYVIDTTAIDQAAAALAHLDEAGMRLALINAFGKQVTESRADPFTPVEDEAPVEGDTPIENDPQEIAFTASAPIPPVLHLFHDPDSRWAYAIAPSATDLGQGDAVAAILYVNGESYATSAAFARALIAGEIESKSLDATLDRELLQTLLGRGVLTLGDATAA